MADESRLDLFLKNSGIIPRRSKAKRACDENLVSVNDKTAKPATTVDVGDVITVRTGMRITQHRVLQIPKRPVPKKQRDQYSELVSSEKVELDI